MKTHFILKIVLGLAVLLWLSGCQSFSGLPGESANPTALPLLSGPRASVLGDSALAFQQSSSNYQDNLVPISASTGEIVAGFKPLEVGQNYQYAFSPNRELLAIVSQGARDCPSICLHLLDLRSWKYSLPPVELSKDSNVIFYNLVFDSLGQKLAVVFNNGNNLSQLVLIDFVQGKIISKLNINFSPIIDAFTPDGSLAVWGTIKQNQHDMIGHIDLLNGNNLTIQWQQDFPQVSYGNDLIAENVNPPTLSRYLSPAAVFSENSSKLYIVLADAPKLLAIDFTHRSVSSMAVELQRSMLEQLFDSTAGVAYAKSLNGTIKTGLLSLDGKYLFVIGQNWQPVKDKDGNWTSVPKPLGLQVIDVSSGTQLSSLITQATDFTLSPDGSMLFLYSWNNDTTSQPTTEVVDVNKLVVVNTLQGQYRPTRLLDGTIAWLYENPQLNYTDRLGIYDPGAKKLRSEWSEPDSSDMFWLAVP